MTTAAVELTVALEVSNISPLSCIQIYLCWSYPHMTTAAVELTVALEVNNISPLSCIQIYLCWSYPYMTTAAVELTVALEVNNISPLSCIQIYLCWSYPHMTTAAVEVPGVPDAFYAKLTVALEVSNVSPLSCIQIYLKQDIRRDQGAWRDGRLLCHADGGARSATSWRLISGFACLDSGEGTASGPAAQLPVTAWRMRRRR